MKRDDLVAKQQQVLLSLSVLPKKILSLHGLDNITEFVLHALCNHDCFNLTKAAYFVDNPDFNCLKGVSGFNRNEAFSSSEHIWRMPEQFSHHMQSSPFNQKVRTVMLCSLKKAGITKDRDTIETIARNLGMQRHAYCAWKQKHDNHGLLLYETDGSENIFDEEQLVNGCSLLGFCPIF